MEYPAYIIYMVAISVIACLLHCLARALKVLDRARAYEVPVGVTMATGSAFSMMLFAIVGLVYFSPPLPVVVVVTSVTTVCAASMYLSIRSILFYGD